MNSLQGGEGRETKNSFVHTQMNAGNGEREREAPWRSSSANVPPGNHCQWRVSLSHIGYKGKGGRERESAEHCQQKQWPPCREVGRLCPTFKSCSVRTTDRWTYLYKSIFFLHFFTVEIFIHFMRNIRVSLKIGNSIMFLETKEELVFSLFWPSAKIRAKKSIPPGRDGSYFFNTFFLL